MSVDDHISTARLVPSLIAALAGLPVGLFTATMEYGLATIGCVASTAAELHAVYRARLSQPVPEVDRVDRAEVIPLRGNDGPRP